MRTRHPREEQHAESLITPPSALQSNSLPSRTHEGGGSDAPTPKRHRAAQHSGSGAAPATTTTAASGSRDGSPNRPGRSNKEVLSEGERRERRRTSNRESARRMRAKHMQMLGELEMQVGARRQAA